MSAYACEPGKGSEPGVGWNLAKAMAAHHDVWVLTRANNREAIEAELSERPVPGLRFVYHDLPRWAAWWKRGGRGVQAYYYLWQLGAISVMRAAHRAVGFELAHHVTFVKYWAPAAAAFVGVPFVWGPVGGGESMPRSFLPSLSPAGRRYEWMRSVARWFGEHDPLVLETAKRAALAFATTPESAGAVRRIGAHPVEVLSAVALTDDERNHLSTVTSADPGAQVLFFSAGNLLDLKGYHLSLEAFAGADLPDARYVLAGDGPARMHLETMADGLGVRDRVEFLGAVPRATVLRWLGRASVFVHPSLHDSGGWATIEAMAAGVPVVCVALGGPATQVTVDSGRCVDARQPEETVRALARSMEELSRSPELRERLGNGAQRRVEGEYTWQAKVKLLSKAYANVLVQESSAQAVGVK